MRSYKTTVTPKMASAWLKLNRRNRPFKQRIVEQYSREMANKNWALTGEAIKFATDGQLIDGQHRLNACIMANTPFETYVIEGLEPTAFNKIDQGKSRSIADAFGRDNKKHYCCLASACAVIWSIEHGRPGEMPSVKMSVDDAFGILKRHPSLEKFVDICTGFPSETCPLSYSKLAAYMAVTYAKHGDKASEFWTMIGTGEGLEPKSMALTLYRKLMHAKKSQHGIHPYARYVYCVKAFNAWIQNKQLKVLSWDMSHEAVPSFQ